MARYHGPPFVYGPMGEDAAFSEPSTATPRVVRDLLARMEAGGQAGATWRQPVLDLRYGYVDGPEHTAWRRAGVALHVVIGGEDVTLRTRWFDDNVVGDGDAMGDGPGRCCELFVVDESGLKIRAGSAPVVTRATDFAVIPSRCSQHERDPFVPLTPEAIMEWLGEAAQAEPLPSRALDLGGDA